MGAWRIHLHYLQSRSGGLEEVGINPTLQSRVELLEVGGEGKMQGLGGRGMVGWIRAEIQPQLDLPSERF